MMRPLTVSRPITICRKRPSTTAAAKKLGSRSNVSDTRPGIETSASTRRKSASSAGVASSSRYRLIGGLPLHDGFAVHCPGAQPQALTQVDVKVRAQVQAQVHAEN